MTSLKFTNTFNKLTFENAANDGNSWQFSQKLNRNLNLFFSRPDRRFNNTSDATKKMLIDLFLDTFVFSLVKLVSLFEICLSFIVNHFFLCMNVCFVDNSLFQFFVEKNLTFFSCYGSHHKNQKKSQNEITNFATISFLSLERISLENSNNC